ncbi:hypothetical protein SO802_009129 [Lithocarpus litseifolius]|uniref:Reverse transcriptase zinc-binding domain-containing protein n=1 Tax=Lithocarpus litseifolius TaxID=425828 RepID=A0AAW2DAJ1_9ROSI
MEEDQELILSIPVLALEEMEPEKRPECCIYKVPKKLRELNREAYTPKLISIGPYHYGQKNLKKMEDLKVRYFNEAAYRTKKNRDDFTRCIQKIEYKKIIHCYAEVNDMIEKDFMQMILLDSIFIIEQLWRTNENPPMNIPAITTISQKCEWKLDACVPFFVLEELYDFAYSGLSMHQQNEGYSFLKLVHEYLLHFLTSAGLVRDFEYKKIFSGEMKKVKHFTDFLRYFLLPQNPTCGRSFERVPCATKLSEAGVEFKVNKSENGRLLDIQFRKSALLGIFPFLNFSWLLSCFPCLKCLEIMQPVLELKSFIIRDATECVVRNLMALEQCYYPWEAYVCNYIVLLDHLINTEADVDLLVEKNVIVNWLGNNKRVATLINGLCLQIIEGLLYYGSEAPSSTSHAWKRIMKGRDVIRKGGLWRIGDGRAISFLGDNLILVKHRPKIVLPIQNMYIGMKRAMAALGGGGGGLLLLPSLDSLRGVGRTSKPSSCPTRASQPPRCRCGPRGRARGLGCRTSCGFGTPGPFCQRTKRASSLCPACQFIDQENGVWKDELLDQWLLDFEAAEAIWQLKVLGKVKNLVWRACQNSLPTEMNLVKRRVITDDRCDLCKDQQLLQQAKDRFQEFSALQANPTPQWIPLAASWRPLDTSWYKINSNGTLYAKENCARIGPVIRNEQGMVMASLSQKIPLPFTVVKVEALAALQVEGKWNLLQNLVWIGLRWKGTP